jgi:Acetyltransferase (GNAT) domain
MGIGHTVYSSVDEVPTAQWELLTSQDSDLTMDRRLLGAMEAKMGADYSYFTILVHDEANVAVGLACSWLIRLDLAQYPWLRKMLAVLPGAVRERLKIGVLFCGLPVPAGQNHIRIAPTADREAVIAEMNRALRQLARREKAFLIAIKEFDAAECAAHDFTQTGFLRCEIPPRHRMVGRFSSFDEYRNSLKARYRAEINRSVKKFAAAGFRAEQVYGPDRFCEVLTDEAHQLYRNVWDRSKYKLEFLSPDFMRDLARRFGPDASLTCIYHGERLAGFTIGLMSGSLYYNVISGLDYELNKLGDVYFNLFYNDMDFAWKRGAGEIDLGLTSDDFKSRLGSRIEPLYLYIDACRRPISWGLRAASPWAFPPLKPVESHNVFKSESAPAGKQSKGKKQLL